MKRILSLMLVLVLGLTILSSCGRPDTGSTSGGKTETESNSEIEPMTSIPEENVDVTEFKTIGDIIAFQPEEYQTTTYDDKYIYAFKAGDGYYRATASIPKDVHEKIDKLDAADGDYDIMVDELVSPLKIEKMEDLAEQMLSPEELNALIGKTGKDLLKDGWTITGYDLDETMFYMGKGVYEYRVYFEGSVEDSDDFDEDAAVKPLVVRKVELEGFGDGAADIE